MLKPTWSKPFWGFHTTLQSFIVMWRSMVVLLTSATTLVMSMVRPDEKVASWG
jgi:hypothetical protein